MSRCLCGTEKNKVVGIEGDYLKIRLIAQPERGKANKVHLRFLAKLLSIPKSRIQIKVGMFSERKVIQISHYGKEHFLKRLGLM